VVVSASHNSPFKVQLLHPVKVSDADTRPLLVFLPGRHSHTRINPAFPSCIPHSMRAGRASCTFATC
jgi:hypothetical protein